MSCSSILGWRERDAHIYKESRVVRPSTEIAFKADFPFLSLSLFSLLVSAICSTRTTRHRKLVIGPLRERAWPLLFYPLMRSFPFAVLPSRLFQPPVQCIPTYLSSSVNTLERKRRRFSSLSYKIGFVVQSEAVSHILPFPGRGNLSPLRLVSLVDLFSRKEVEGEKVAATAMI